MRYLAPIVGIVAGCLRPDTSQPEQLDRGYVLMLPGVEGSTWQLRGVTRALRQAGVGQAIESHAWGSHPFCQLYNLCALETNRQRAKKIAALISDYHAAHPGAPITLIGYSGGGGMAVLALEALPENVVLDRVILVSAAVSPQYNLERILTRTRRVVNFYSHRDWLIMGFGTSVFGTIDRVRTESAGKVGFLDEHGRLIGSDRITQIAWVPDWWDLGHYGGHIGWLSPSWVREVLAPQIEPLPRIPALAQGKGG